MRDVDPALIEPQPLGDLQTYVDQIRNQVRAIPGNRANLTSAAGVVPNIMTTARTHFPRLTADSATRASKAAAIVEHGTTVGKLTTTLQRSHHPAHRWIEA